MSEQTYMNTVTGSTGTRDEWDYLDEAGNTVNAVDRGEVVEVKWDEETHDWVEVDA